MRRTAVIAAVFVLLGLAFLSYWTSKRTKGRSGGLAPSTSSATATNISSLKPTATALPQSVPTDVEGSSEAAKIVAGVFSAPISFFGKVQDQDGVPISEAKVEFGAIDKFWETGSNYQTISDANGLFSITGIQGAGLTVAVAKEGYDGIKGFSYQSFGYGMPPDSTRKKPPLKDVPAIFVMRKRAKAEPLFSVRGDIAIPKDGTPVEVSLRTAKPVSKGTGDIMIECWTSDDRKDAQGRYPWKFRLSAPGGGLMVRKDPETSFEAPESGYVPTVYVEMAQVDVRWQRDSDEQYWVNLRNGTFARMRFRITTAGAHFAAITAYLNPSGSRNLEYDPNRILK